MNKPKFDKNKIFDEVVRREKRRKIRFFLILAAIILAFGSLFSYSVVKNYEQVKQSHDLRATITAIEDGEKGKVVSLRLPSKEIITLTVTDELGKTLSIDKTVSVLQEKLASGQVRYSLAQ